MEALCLDGVDLWESQVGGQGRNTYSEKMCIALLLEKIFFWDAWMAVVRAHLAMWPLDDPMGMTYPLQKTRADVKLTSHLS